MMVNECSMIPSIGYLCQRFSDQKSVLQDGMDNGSAEAIF